MKDITPKSFWDLLEEVADAILRTLRYGLRTLQRMSWPALLLSCVMLAFVISILPLALVLFTIFMLVKLVVGVGVIGQRRHRDAEHKQ